MGKYFGTDGIRGMANVKITPELAMAVGKATAAILKESSPKKPHFLIGRDTRLSGNMIENALCAGISAMGCDVTLLGVAPTPAIAFLTKHLQADCGVVISASHNPFADNGIKLFSRHGFKLSDEEEARIEKILSGKEKISQETPTGSQVGEIKTNPEILKIYKNHLKKIAGGDFSPYTIAIDCANGAASCISPQIFQEMGATTFAINCCPNGVNINENCGSTHPEMLSIITRQENFDAGFAFDGDGDRLIAVDEKGEMVDGDEMMNILARFYKEKNQLENSRLVATVMSNIGLEISLKEAGVEMMRAQVGDRHVLEMMQKNGAIIGGEQSGHIIFLKDNTTGDGIITAIHLLKIMKETGLKLSQLKATMKRYPQVLKNIQVEDKKRLMENKEFQTYLASLQESMGDKYRILVRSSGTEPKVRIMAEGPDIKSTENLVKEICREAEKFTTLQYR